MSLKRVPSPALVIACIALALSLGGVGYAATDLPKNSVGSAQLRKGSVRPSKLSHATIALISRQTKRSGGSRGSDGAKGDTGAKGPKGATGATGVQGPAGPFADVLPSGKTVRGAYAIYADAAVTGIPQREAISFGFGLASPPTPHVITQFATPDCPGNVSEPQAAPGQLCIYQDVLVNSSTATVTLSASYGAILTATATAKSLFGNTGSWAVTAA